MARHPTSRRVPRAVESSDDRFVAGVLETSVWAKRHARLLITGGLLLVVLTLGFVWLRNQRQIARDQATIELTQVRQTVLTGNFALAIRDLEGFLLRYDATPAANEARILLAQAYLETGQPARAIDAVERMARDPASPLGATAAFLKGAAHETLEQGQRAEDVYLRIADRGRFLFERLEAFEQAARLRLERGDARGAAQLLDRALASIPEDREHERAIFEMRLAEAMAAAGS